MLITDFEHAIREFIESQWPDAIIDDFETETGPSIIVTIDRRHFGVLVIEIPSVGTCHHIPPGQTEADRLD